MDNKTLRIIVDANQFCALEECDPVDFADHYEDYFVYMREALSKKYKVPCVIEYCSGGYCAVYYSCNGNDFKLCKQVVEDNFNGKTGVIDFNEFVESSHLTDDENCFYTSDDSNPRSKESIEKFHSMIDDLRVKKCKN